MCTGLYLLTDVLVTDDSACWFSAGTVFCAGCIEYKTGLTEPSTTEAPIVTEPVTEPTVEEPTQDVNTSDEYDEPEFDEYE